MKLKRFILALFPVVAIACSVKEEEVVIPQQDTVSNKILCKGIAEVDPASFLVKFNNVPSSEMITSILTRRGVTEVTPLFTHMPGKEAIEAKYGLDRWYEVMVDAGENLDFAVQECAAEPFVSVVQYNVACSKSEADQDYAPAQEELSTKGTLLFNKFSDPMFGDQWHYINTGNPKYGTGAVAGADINVKDVWGRLTCGDPSIIVAVVDQGVKYTHPDLQANMWVNTKEIPGDGIDNDGNGYVDDIYGYNFVDKTAAISWDTSGDTGHGTHCAGTIAAVSNNNRGVAGVAGGSGKNDGCKIMSCQIFSHNVGGTSSVSSKAIKYAADMGASIISCSFGFKFPFSSDNHYISSQSSAEIDAIHYFEDEAHKNNDVLGGNIAIFAAGNERNDYAHYPGAFVDIISVSAFGPDFLPAPYTNYGPGCNIAAPGGNFDLGNRAAVLSTVPSELSRWGGSDYGYMNGTSMACPHVSGVVALGLSYAKQLGKKFSLSEFKQMILASTNDIDQRIGSTTLDGYAKYYHQMGTGAIDAWRLMMHIEGTPAATAQVGRKQWIDLTPLLGTSSTSLTYLDLEVSQETIDALGLQKIQGKQSESSPAIPSNECYAYIQYGRIYIHPTKMGSGKFMVKVVGGGDHVGGGDNPPGGMELDREISLIARYADGGNGTGGWL